MVKRLFLQFRILLMLSVAVIACRAQDSLPSVANNALPATGTTAGPDTRTELQFQQRNPRYTIRTGDSFDVNFELSPEFNQNVTVQPDGYITLKSVGDLYVAGQSVPQLTETLRQSYGKILNDPPISVILKDFEKPYFVADGQVTHPGKYDLRGDVTLTEAVAMAGGFNENAKHSQVLLFRRVNNDWLEAKLINVKKMQKEGNLHEDPLLRPGDMVFVPKNTLSKIQRFLPNSSFGAFVPLTKP